MTSGEARREARKGKRVFLVRVVKEERFRVWAIDSEAAEEEVYWRRSSGRAYPAVDDLGRQPEKVFTEPSEVPSEADRAPEDER